MSFTPEEVNEFKAEAFELLEGAERSLFELEAGAAFEPAFDAVFRAFHNLKGASGMMELFKLQEHVHALETLLMKFKGGAGIPSETVSLFLRGIDAARLILDGQDVQFSIPQSTELETLVEGSLPKVVETPAAPPIEMPAGALQEFVAESTECLERVSVGLRELEKGQGTQELLQGLYRDLHSLKGSAFLFGFETVGSIAHQMESSMEPIREQLRVPDRAWIDAHFACVSYLESCISALAKGGTIHDDREMREKLCANLKDADQALKPKVKSQVEATPKSKPAEAVAEGEGAGTIRVPIALLDNLMTLVGEMVLVRNQVLQFSSSSEDLDFLNLSKRLNVVTSEIQGEMMKTRMQPIGNVLNKYHRVVRDLSQELKKGINLNISGAETELDKSLLESIKDPLTHIVRNSCDHGIETPDARRGAGKSDAGTIGIRSYHEGGQVVIEVTDDGKGLQKQALIRKAIEKGVLTQADAASLSEKETFNLIFAPGLSTAKEVTNVSGRGVGMDVVRTNIEKIGGTVELTSIEGKGTTTRIKIPLTLAIIPALIVKSGAETFAIPQVKLDELVRVDSSSAESKIEYLHGSPVFRLRGNILPLVDLRRILNKPDHGEKASSISNIAVVNADQCTFGLIVDEVQDTADIVVKPLSRLLRSLQIYSGATILGDGSIALILDIHGIAKVARIGSRAEGATSVKSERRHSSDAQEYLLVRVGSPTRHAVVLGYVHRLEEFNRSAIEDSGGMRVIRYGKQILPLISLNATLGYTVKTTGDTISVVVIEKAGALYGLEVDEIVDTLFSEVELDSSLVRKRGLFGNLNAPEGLIVVVDPFDLIDVSLGVSTPASGVIPPTTASVQAPKKLRILFAEDTVFFRKAVHMILGKEGHEVTLANDGEEALQKLRAAPSQFDLIVSDIEMPRLNGFDFARAVRSLPETRRMPMLALSSRADARYAEMGREAGFDRYLEKLKPAALLQAISELTTTADRRAA